MGSWGVLKLGSRHLLAAGRTPDWSRVLGLPVPRARTWLGRTFSKEEVRSQMNHQSCSVGNCDPGTAWSWALNLLAPEEKRRDAQEFWETKLQAVN